MNKKELDYINILKALTEIPFGVGKKLLADFLIGKTTNNSIKKNKLEKLNSFGSLAYSEDEIIQLIDSLTLNHFIAFVSVPWNKFLKVLEITEKGRAEILNPQLYLTLFYRPFYYVLLLIIATNLTLNVVANCHATCFSQIQHRL